MRRTFGLVFLCAFFLSCGIAAAGAAIVPGDNVTERDDKAKAQQAVAVNTMQTAVTASTGMVTSRIAAVQAPGGGGVNPAASGKSSGNGANGFGVWALGGAYYLDSSKSGAKYDGGLYSAMVGIDKEVGRALVGVAFGYEGLDLDTNFNSGSLKYNGFTVMPYASYAITDDIIADLSLGATWLNYDIKDTQNNEVGRAQRYSSSYDAMRYVVSGGVSKYFLIDKWTLSARLGGLYAHESQDSYRVGFSDISKQNIEIGQVSLGGKAAYDMGNGFQPFFAATYRQDVAKSGPNDDMAGGDFDLGFNWQATDQLKLGLTGTYGIRENFSMVGGMANIRFEF